MLYSFETRCRAVAAMRSGMSPARAAASVGASRATGYRWLARYRAGGWAGLRERPSTPKRQPRRLSQAEEAEIVAARERSGAGPLTLGAMLGRPASTVGKVLRRLGRSRLPREPRPPVVRYERERPGELVHIDTKKLGRFWNVGSASSATGSRAARAPAGSTYTSPSTTTRGWPTPRCSPATAATTRSPSSSGRCAGSANRASRSRQ